MQASAMKELLQNGKCDAKLASIYVCETDKVGFYRNRILEAIDSFEELYGKDRDIYLFSAPGRTEVGGNHTDHQHGCVLAASVNLDVIAIVSKNADTHVSVKSKGFQADELDATDILVHEEEKNSSISLVRGIIAKFTQLGCKVGGFDAYTTSNVLAGSGLSSSAAFEVLIGTVINTIFFDGKETALKIAQIGQYAENVFFGKPSGLMDQAASSIGGFVAIDFGNFENPKVKKIDFNFGQCGYALCIIDTKGSHSDLTPDYAAVPAEMKAVANFFGKDYLREVDEAKFYEQLSALRGKVSDRAILRAIHFFSENKRAQEEAKALDVGDFEAFKQLVLESGRSSFCYLQNVFSVSHPSEQGVSLALALCERLLAPIGGIWRVHGGGFAGTVQAFVPTSYLEKFIEKMNGVLGEGSCHSLQIRPVGGIQIL